MSDETVLEEILRRTEGMRPPVALYVRPDRLDHVTTLVEGTELKVRSSSLITDDRVFLFSEPDALYGFREVTQ